jgi:hypothetical protein
MLKSILLSFCCIFFIAAYSQVKPAKPAIKKTGAPVAKSTGVFNLSECNKWSKTDIDTTTGDKTISSKQSLGASNKVLTEIVILQVMLYDNSFSIMLNSLHNNKTFHAAKGSKINFILSDKSSMDFTNEMEDDFTGLESLSFSGSAADKKMLARLYSNTITHISLFNDTSHVDFSVDAAMGDKIKNTITCIASKLKDAPVTAVETIREPEDECTTLTNKQTDEDGKPYTESRLIFPLKDASMGNHKGTISVLSSTHDTQALGMIFQSEESGTPVCYNASVRIVLGINTAGSYSETELSNRSPSGCTGTEVLLFGGSYNNDNVLSNLQHGIITSVYLYTNEDNFTEYNLDKGDADILQRTINCISTTLH